MLLKQIVNKLPKKDISDLYVKLGYNLEKIAQKTLNNFLIADSICSWLESGHYDMHHTSKSFLLKLSGVLL